MIHVALQSLRRRPARSMTAVLGIAVAVSIAFVLSGVTAAFNREVDTTLDQIGDGYLIPDGATGLLTGLVDVSIAPPGTSPLLFARDVVPGQELDLNLFGVDDRVIELAEGRQLDGAGEIVVDASADVGIGDTIVLSGESLSVVGVTTGTRIYAGGPVAFVSYSDMRRLYFNDRGVARAFVGWTSGEAPDGLAIMSRADARDDLIRPVRGAIASLALTRTLVWVLVAGAVYVLNRLALLDRRNELAALRCLGAGSGAIGVSLVIEGALVGVVGAALGCLLGSALAPLFPLTVEISAVTALAIVALAAGVALAAAAIGVWQLRRIAPNDAFRSGIS